MKMHFVAFVVIVNVFLVMNACGDDSLHRDKRSPKSKYDKNYDQFLERHFADVGEKHLDKKQQYKDAQSDDDSDDHDSQHNSDHDSDGDHDSDHDSDDHGKGKNTDDDHEDAGDAKDDAESYGVDHGWYYDNQKDYERIKALSEKQVVELLKKPENCKQYEKDGMVCATCEDPETGDNSESCAFSSQPNDKKVAYLSKKSHNYKTPKRVEAEDAADEGHEENEDDDEAAVNPSPTGPKPLRSESEDADYGAYKLAGTDHDVEDYDEPKFGQFRATEPSQTEKYVNDFEIIPQKQFESKNLNQALTNFNTKDWKNCNKIMKGDMTCYYCKDHKGAVQEECMFISASNPKNYKVERHESMKYDNTKKPSKSSAYKIAPVTPQPDFFAEKPEDQDKKQRFARLRIGRPLMPTRASVKSTAEPLVTPKSSFVDPNEHDDYSSSPNKKTIKRTVAIRKKVFDNDRYEPAESRAISFRSFVRHFD